MKKTIAAIPRKTGPRSSTPARSGTTANTAGSAEAQIAETSFTAFTSHPKSRQVHCRLVLRRVKRLNPASTTGQDELFTTWRHHGFITNSTLTTSAADETHRDHAIIEQVIAELK
ncbi:MAG: IS1380 family transposase, partial [Actinomycetota bacterium]|nr:IS1380 family transposase [Actinomycetota bacterium]